MHGITLSRLIIKSKSFNTINLCLDFVMIYLSMADWGTLSQVVFVIANFGMQDKVTENCGTVDFVEINFVRMILV